MKTLKGKPTSPGFAQGKAYIYEKSFGVRIPYHHITSEQIPKECDNIDSAIEDSIAELDSIEKSTIAEHGTAQSQIFASHIALLMDPRFIEKVKNMIRKDRLNAVLAFDREAKALMSAFNEVAEDEHIRAKAQDVKDVLHRVLRHLGHDLKQTLEDLPRDCVVVAHELLPSDTLNLDRENVVAVVTEVGGATSHSAILARAMGIPLISQVKDACNEIPAKSDLLVDGTTGTVTVGAGQDIREKFTLKKNHFDNVNAMARKELREHCKTKNGVEITLKGNIGRAYEADDVLKYKLAGVGLLRTEHLFLKNDEPPSLNQQADAYGYLAGKLKGRPVTVRTFDFGGHKKPRFLEGEQQIIPRGLRFSLEHPNIFKKQLRAIFTVYEKYPNIEVMFPMVGGRDDLLEVRDIAKQIACELGLEKLPRLGAMIETPSALNELNEVMEMSDFISIGTNDLCQFVLNKDRGSIDEEAILNPGVIEKIKMAVEMAKEKSVPISVCGEAAGNQFLACILVGLGICELSMSPLRAPLVNYTIRQQNFKELMRISSEYLRA